MSKRMALIIVGFGAALIALGWWLRQAGAGGVAAASFAGLGGGGLILGWGLAALAGVKGRGWALLTGAVTEMVLVTQVVHVWVEGNPLPERLLVTVMFFLGLAVVLYLVHGERPPEYYSGTGHRTKPGANPNANSSRARRDQP